MELKSIRAITLCRSRDPCDRTTMTNPVAERAWHYVAAREKKETRIEHHGCGGGAWPDSLRNRDLAGVLRCCPSPDFELHRRGSDPWSRQAAVVGMAPGA